MKRKARRGYALVVVLFSLSVLAILFASASTRVFHHIETASAEQLLQQNRHDAFDAMERLLATGLPEDGHIWNWTGPDGTEQQYFLQSTGGLVDLNNANPKLLERLLVGYGLARGEVDRALQNYRAWRRQGLRLLRVSDFYRVAQLDAAQLPRLPHLATVYSGRSGISVDQAPLHLLEHLTGQSGTAQALIALLPPEFSSPPGGTNFLMLEQNPTGKIVANLHFGPDATQSRILSAP